MIDAHHVPPELQNLLMILVGNKWPTGDEAALRSEALVWRETAETLRTCADDLVRVSHQVEEGLQGLTQLAFADYVAGLAGTGRGDATAIVPSLAACCESAALALEDLANEIETLRVTIIGCLVVLFVQLAIDAIFWVVGGAAKAAADIAATRAFLTTLLRRAIVTAATRAAESMVAQVGFTLLAQLIQLAEGHRKSLDGDQLRTAAVNGAVGGAVGVGAGFLGGALRSGAGRLMPVGAGQMFGTGRIVPAVAKGTGELVGRAGYGALTGMAEGAAQDAVYGLSGDWVSGAANGAFNGAWGARHSAMNPGNNMSISPGDHLEGRLNGYLERPGRPRPPAGDEPVAAAPHDDRPPTPIRDGDPEGWSDVDRRPVTPMPPSPFNPWADAEPGGGVSPPRDSRLPAELEDNPWADGT